MTLVVKTYTLVLRLKQKPCQNREFIKKSKKNSFYSTTYEKLMINLGICLLQVKRKYSPKAA